MSTVERHIDPADSGRSLFKMSIRKRLEIHRQRKGLMELDDRMLRDIGLTREMAR